MTKQAAIDPKQRRRGAELHRAIEDAAWAELVQHGYDGFTMDGVAARAGTSKPVIYRRWPSRAALVIDTVTHHRSQSAPPSTTGRLGEDLIALLAHLAAPFNGETGPVLRGLMIDTLRDPELGGMAHDLLDDSPEAAGITTLLGRAVTRGEVAAERLTPVVLSLPLTLLRHEVLVNGIPISPRFIERIVTELLLPLLTSPIDSRCR
ncbi:TetR/AcrR family transcriptional regulator [Gryllotalpicola koreensis]|jgi:AcrR family transcriptional regulator|uniref:TetR/AcrR family transcriptional regulator n=1 Tax=Gryllotalpicola koreensis TaxID=993086 RepID=A0ABP7ZQK6_9MICO